MPHVLIDPTLLMCMKRFSYALRYLVLGALVVSLAACDSNDGPDADAEVISEISVMFEEMSDVLALVPTPGFFLGFGKAAQAEPVAQLDDDEVTVPCGDGGTAVYTVIEENDDDDGTFGLTYNVVFTGCDGVSGALEYAYEGQVTQSSYRFEFRTNGQASGTCELRYNRLTQSFGADLTNGGTDAAVTITFNGSFSAMCPSGSVNCSFNNESYSYSASSGDPLVQDDLFANNCS